MNKICEHTYGSHIYMKIELSGEIYEIDYYIRGNEYFFKTTADGTDKRKAVIDAFNSLY